MRLEDEIKQKKFESERQKLLVNLIFTGNWIKDINSQMLKPFGLTTQQYNILRILRGQHPKPASVNLLIDRMMDKMSNASRLVEKLRLKGFVERRECEKDRRQADVVVTKEGLELLKRIDSAMVAFEKRFEHISEEESAQVNMLLDKLRD